MRHALMLSAVLLAVSGPVYAQANPSAEQMVKGLLPSDAGGLSRGIRLQQPGTPPVKPPTVDLHVNFATGSVELTPAAMKVLDTLGGALNDARLSGARFRIEGHTDTVGAPEDNKALSDRRAAAVADYLTAKHNVDRARLTSVGMGQQALLIATPAGTPEVRNRRVTVVNLGG